VAIADGDVDKFWRDGVVCLRGVVEPGSLDELADPIEQLMASDGGVDLAATVKQLRTQLAAGDSASDPLFGDLRSDDFLEDALPVSGSGGAKFFTFTHVYPVCEPVRRFEMESVLPQIAARLLRSDTLHLFIDQIFVKEPGTATRTAFHVDESYFNLTGEQVCTIWVPLDTVTKDSSTMGYVPGSHLWNQRFIPNNFISQNPSPLYRESVRDVTRSRLPDIEADPDAFGVVYYDVGPGDVIVHHYRTIHGSGGNTTQNQRRRALSIPIHRR
jgi:hypothetical protein